MSNMRDAAMTTANFGGNFVKLFKLVKLVSDIQ